MMAVVIIYSTIVWAWWPTDTMIGGVSLVVYLMAAGVLLWVLLSFAFVSWVERLERREGAR